MRKVPIRDEPDGDIIGWAYLHQDGTATIQLDGSEAGQRIARLIVGSPEAVPVTISSVGLGPAP